MEIKVNGEWLPYCAPTTIVGPFQEYYAVPPGTFLRVVIETESSNGVDMAVSHWWSDTEQAGPDLRVLKTGMARVLELLERGQTK